MLGLRLHPSIRALGPVLKELQALFVQAGRAFPQDDQFWFNERTFNGLLSTASWRCGLPSLIEAKTKRKAGTKATGAGHFDVRIAERNRFLVIESKITWIPVPDRTEDLLGKLEDAIEEAAGLPSDAGVRIAMAIGVLEHKQVEPKQLLAKSLKILCPKKLEILSWLLDDGQQANTRFPGYILVGRIAK